MPADWWQHAPIPESGALFRPPIGNMSQGARDMVNLFWSSDKNSVSQLWELTIQKRCEDPWYDTVLAGCRDGQLSEELYNVSAWLSNITLWIMDATDKTTT